MFNIFKSKAQRENDTLIAQTHPACAYAGVLMYVAKNPQVVNNKKFLKEFNKLQTAWFEYYTSAYKKFADLQLDLTKHNEQLICSAMAVIIASVLEGNYTLEETEEHNGLLNIIKKEANLNNIPRVYADAYIKFYETESVA